MEVVTDTHSIVWYFTNDPLLSETALAAFEGTSKEGLIIIPAVVLAEIMFIKNRAKYPTCKGGDESPRAEGTKNMI
jgi:PIN domain nuclease of toxin-antitoxin system